jgi:hypothetical protein
LFDPEAFGPPTSLGGLSFAADEVLSLVKDRDKLATALLGGTT